MKIKSSVWMVSVSVMLTVLSAGPSQAEQGRLPNLEAVLKEALASNPQILAAKNAFEAADARIAQAGALSDPSVEFEYDRITADRMLSGDPMKTLAVTQDIPFPTKLNLRAKIASKLAKMAYENYKTKEREVVAGVKNAYSELALIYKQIQINSENKGVLDQLA
ncbi:MAG: TolC family protein, partial [Candidatus Omnitrophota bacterium]